MPDIVLDDGSHVMTDFSATFDFLYPRTVKDGVYMVEDLHTAYWPEFGGGHRREGSFIERCKDMVDDLNAHWTRGTPPVNPFTETTQSIHLYDSIAVFERGRTLNRTADLVPPEARRLR